jgi:4-hydroxy 2-oxovalerate aldolase
MPVIEVTHGDGLGGSSFNYGFSKVDERVLMKAAVETAKRAKIAALMLPGLGTKDRHQGRRRPRRVDHPHRHALHRGRHLDPALRARPRDRDGDGRLPDDGALAAPEVLAAQARIMADAGCQCVYVVDSAGAMILEDVTVRVQAVVAELGDDAQVGFHGHENLGLSVANSVLAVRAGAVQIDGSTRAFGAGAGNTPLEVFAAVAERQGIGPGSTCSP